MYQTSSVNLKRLNFLVAGRIYVFGVTVTMKSDNFHKQHCGGECRLLPNKRLVCEILIDVVFFKILKIP